MASTPLRFRACKGRRLAPTSPACDADVAPQYFFDHIVLVIAPAKISPSEGQSGGNRAIYSRPFAGEVAGRVIRVDFGMSAARLLTLR